MQFATSPDVYTPHLNEPFVLHRPDGGTHTLTLKAVDTSISDDIQLCFSLLFAAEKDVVLPQHIYRMGHAQLGEFELFLVPIRHKRNGLLYEAVFNLLNDEAL